MHKLTVGAIYDTVRDLFGLPKPSYISIDEAKEIVSNCFNEMDATNSIIEIRQIAAESIRKISSLRKNKKAYQDQIRKRRDELININVDTYAWNKLKQLVSFVDYGSSAVDKTNFVRMPHNLIKNHYGKKQKIKPHKQLNVERFVKHQAKIETIHYTSSSRSSALMLVGWDLDNHNHAPKHFELAQLRFLTNKLKEIGINPHVEQSKNGWHIYFVASKDIKDVYKLADLFSTSINNLFERKNLPCKFEWLGTPSIFKNHQFDSCGKVMALPRFQTKEEVDNLFANVASLESIAKLGRRITLLREDINIEASYTDIETTQTKTKTKSKPVKKQLSNFDNLTDAFEKNKCQTPVAMRQLGRVLNRVPTLEEATHAIYANPTKKQASRIAYLYKSFAETFSLQLARAEGKGEKKSIKASDIRDIDHWKNWASTNCPSRLPVSIGEIEIKLDISPSFLGKIISLFEYAIKYSQNKDQSIPTDLLKLLFKIYHPEIKWNQDKFRAVRNYLHRIGVIEITDRDHSPNKAWRYGAFKDPNTVDTISKSFEMPVNSFRFENSQLIIEKLIKKEIKVDVAPLRGTTPSLTIVKRDDIVETLNNRVVIRDLQDSIEDIYDDYSSLIFIPKCNFEIGIESKEEDVLGELRQLIVKDPIPIHRSDQKTEENISNCLEDTIFKLDTLDLDRLEAELEELFV